MKKLLVEMTVKQAEMLGILRCESCGYPPNNHFEWGQRLCAHSNKCTGYVPGIRLPKP